MLNATDGMLHATGGQAVHRTEENILGMDPRMGMMRTGNMAQHTRSNHTAQEEEGEEEEEEEEARGHTGQKVGQQEKNLVVE